MKSICASFALVVLVIGMTSPVRSMEVIPQVGHPSTVGDLAVSPSRKLLASCGQDRTVRIYQIDDLRELRIFKAHTHACVNVAWLDDTTVVSLGFHRDLLVHDIAQGRLLGRISIGYGVLAKQPLKTIGKRIYVLKSRNEIPGTTGMETYAIENGELQRVSIGRTELALRGLSEISVVNRVGDELAFYDTSRALKMTSRISAGDVSSESFRLPSGDKVALVGVSGNGKLGVFKSEGGGVVVSDLSGAGTRIETNCKGVYGQGRVVKFNSGDSQFGCVDGDQLLVYSVGTKKVVGKYRLDSDEGISSFDWLDDRVIIGGYEGTIRITHPDIELKGTERIGGNIVIEFSRDSKSFYLWPHVDFPGPQTPIRVDFDRLQIGAMPVPPVEHGLYALTENGLLVLVDQKSVSIYDALGKRLSSASIRGDRFRNGSRRRMSRVGNNVFITGDGILARINIANLANQEYRTIDSCGSPRFLHQYDESTLLLGGDNVCLLDIRSDQSVAKKLSTEDFFVTDARRIPNSSLIATTTGDGALVFLDPAKVASEIRGFGIYKDPSGGGAAKIEGLAVHPSGNVIATGSLTSEIKVCSSEEGLRSKPTTLDIQTLRGHNTWVYGAAYSPDGKYLVSSSPDGSVVIWNAVTSEVIATVVYRKKDGFVESIIVTPEGFFSANSYAAADMATLRDGTHASGVAKYWDVFHRPDIVRAKLRGEDIRPLIGDLTIEKALQNPPPKVTLPSIADSTSAKRLKIPYSVTPDAGGVAEVRVFQNGKLISSDGTYKDAPGKTYAPVAGKSVDAARFAETRTKERNATRIDVGGGAGSLRDQLIVRGAPEKKCAPGKAGDPCKGEIEVDVIPGVENTITVVAFNRDNTIQSVPASVTFKSTLPQEAPHLWVVGVGIDKFAGVSSLKNARKDAEDFVCTYAGKNNMSGLGLKCNEEGKAKGLFKAENIHVIDALLDQAASKANILGALDKVAKQAKPGDTFVWFVASHGMMDANSNFGVVAYDTQCLNDNCTDIKGHLTSNEILEASKKIKAMKQLVVLDTCHSGGLDAKLSGLYDARVSLLAKNMGLHLYASAQATEAAQDGDPGTNGTFTAQLLAGIKGAAPKNKEGQISVMTLGDYVKSKTAEVTQPKIGAKDARPAQTPVIQHFGQDAAIVGTGI